MNSLWNYSYHFARFKKSHSYPQKSHLWQVQHNLFRRRKQGSIHKDNFLTDSYNTWRWPLGPVKMFIFFGHNLTWPYFCTFFNLCARATMNLIIAGSYFLCLVVSIKMKVPSHRISIITWKSNISGRIYLMWAYY